MRYLVIAGLSVFLCSEVWAALSFEAGVGVQHYVQYTQGTLDLKFPTTGVFGSFGLRYFGERRVYYTVFGRADYFIVPDRFTQMGADVGLLGLGVYLTSPLYGNNGLRAVNRWFATMDINFANVRFGGSAVPHTYGSDMFVQYALPLSFRFWKMRTQRFGVGAFVEASYILNWPFGRSTYLYEMSHGFSAQMGLMFFLR